MCDDIPAGQLLEHTRPQRSRCHSCCSRNNCSRWLSKYGRWRRCSSCKSPLYNFKLLRSRDFQHFICRVFSCGTRDGGCSGWFTVLLLWPSAYLRWTRVPCCKLITLSEACRQSDRYLGHSCSVTSLDRRLCSLWSNAGEPAQCSDKTRDEYEHSLWIWIVATSKHNFELWVVGPISVYGRCASPAHSVGKLIVQASSRHAHCYLPN